MNIETIIVFLVFPYFVTFIEVVVVDVLLVNLLLNFALADDIFLNNIVVVLDTCLISALWSRLIITAAVVVIIVTRPVRLIRSGLEELARCLVNLRT